MWGTTWLDHLQLILPLGIVLVLIVRSLLAVRLPPSEDSILLLCSPPGEDQGTAPGASGTFSARSSGPLTHSSSTVQPRPVNHPEQKHVIEPPEHSHEPWYAEIPTSAEPLMFPEQAKHVEDLEHQDRLQSTWNEGFAWDPEPATPRSHADETPTIGIAMHEGSLVEFLPGRLEILAGILSDREFRFQRVVGAGAPEVTLGRAPGPAYRHIQLSAPTVSRIHARMRFENDRWMIRNLSEANPLHVQGELITEPHALVDGDALQIGEVLLCYRDGRP